MQMTNEEIVREYTQAANKSKQIKILADLNTVSPSEIQMILAQAGVAGVKEPARIVRRRSTPPQAVEETPPAASAGIYDRIETILSAMPEDATKDTRDVAKNLVIALFSDHAEKRLGREGRNEAGTNI